MKIVSFPFTDIIETPLGKLLIKATQTHIHELSFIDNDAIDINISPSALINECKEQIAQYFEGTRTQFILPLFYEDSGFQQKVTELLLSVPFGETISYMELAKLTGDEKNIRAVANANARNKIAVIIPCHRVIGSNGKLTGYAWGLNRKQQLLDFEGKQSGKRWSLF